ncbi:MAG: hypothetical protein K0R75_1000 [Paenibacillaceae bacterium]|nr:hypothetical protein [Paenibacillaceae bacterium]
MELRLGEATAYVDGIEVELSDPTTMIDGSIYVPLRSFCELLGAVVSWNDVSRTVYIANGATPLPVVGSEEELRALLEQSRQGALGAGGIVEEAIPLVKPAPSLQKNASSAERVAPPAADGGAATGGSAGGGGAVDYSTTNIQEQGVDEADIVKTDGEYIYTVSQGRVMIVRAYPAEHMELVGQIALEQFRPQELYVDDERLVVIGSTVTPAPLIKQKAAANLPITPTRYPVVVSTSMKALIYDISDKSNIVKQRELELGGRYVTSRKIGSALYLVANKQSYAYVPMAEGGSMRADIPEPPTYRDSAGGGELSDLTSLGYDRIRYFPDSLFSSYLVIGSIDLAVDRPDFDVQAYLGAGQTVYASDKNLYVTTTRSQLSVDSLTPDSPTQQTAIYRFALDRGKARYAAQGSVPGTPLNQWSMDETDGYFRIATTASVRSAEHFYTTKNNLYILDETLQVTGSLENLAPGERIYSVRFMDSRGYLVTFKRVDPLFAIDLSDPHDPHVLGQLKIPGYSDYLQPYDENHLIGFGKNTTAATGAQPIIPLGMKMALFDVTDVAHPTQLFEESIGERGTDSPLLHNPKALLFSKERGLIAFPVTVWEEATSRPAQRGLVSRPAFQGAYVFSLDLASGFNLRGKIPHQQIERILYIGDRFYTVSPTRIQANDYDTLGAVSELTLK